MMDTEAARTGWWYRRSRWQWFGLTFLLFFGYLLGTRFKEQYYDAAFYWFLANSYDQAGASAFSLYNFSSALRGYLLPLLMYPAALVVREAGPQYLAPVVKFIGACWAGALFGVACPVLWEQVAGRVVGPVRRLLFIGVCFWLWRDYFNFLLSDFPAILALLTALLLLYRVPRPGVFFAVGLLMAATVYMRPIYLLAMPLVLALLVQKAYAPARAGWRQVAGKRLGLVVLGFLLVGFPQYLINSNNYQSHSYLVLMEGTNDTKQGHREDLFLFLLHDGIAQQRYETNVGPGYHGAQVAFGDAQGQALLAAASNTSFSSYGDYVTFVLNNPLGMSGVYLRHLFNGLDLLYSGPYIYDVYGTKWPNALVVYTVIFAALLVMVRRIGRVEPRHWLLLGAILITVPAVIPLIIECRFLLPLHLLLYAVACFGWPRAWTWRQTTLGQRLAVVAGYSLFLVLCFTVSRNAQQQIAVKAPTARVN